ncbi:MAG: hypothetical protein RL342_1082, partial [Pseudomonadota bacterium]
MLHQLKAIFALRYATLACCVLVLLLSLFLLLVHGMGWSLLLGAAGLVALGVHDLLQTHHSI